jgi:hypothetical protein
MAMKSPPDPAGAAPLPPPPILPPPGPAARAKPALPRLSVAAQILICILGTGAGWYLGWFGALLHEGMDWHVPGADPVGHIAGALSGLLAAWAWLWAVRLRATNSALSRPGWVMLCSILAGMGAAAGTHGALLVCDLATCGWAHAADRFFRVVGVGVILHGTLMGLLAGGAGAIIQDCDSLLRRPRR